MPAGDNPHSISEKKAALRESPKQPKNAVVNQQARASPLLKVKAAEIVGTKRPQPSGPLSPTNHHVTGNPGANGHLVYVRRKLETDHNKGGASAGTESATSLSSKKPVVGAQQEQTLKHQNSVPNTQSAPASASPAVGASVPVLHSASLPANLSFGKQSPGKVSVHPSVAASASPPQCNTQSAPVSASPAATASVPALHSASLSPNLSFGKQSPGKVSVHPSVVATASPPQHYTQSSPVSASPAAAASVPALHSASLPAHLSFAKQSPGKVTVQSSVVAAASPPQRKVVPTAMLQNLTAANTASPPQRNVLSTPQNFTAANAASPSQRSVVSAAMPQNFRAANNASPTHRNVVSTAVPQNFTAANMAPCNVATASTASLDAVVTTTARSPANSQKPSNQDWKQRFIGLQAFLRNNEQSGQEEYIRMLQSMSSVGRSKHAIELEKRAVNLLIEEGKELQKMKALNVLGKLPPTDHPTQATFAMRLPFQPFPTRR